MKKRNSVMDCFLYFKMNFLLDVMVELILFAVGFGVGVVLCMAYGAEERFPFGVMFAAIGLVMMTLFSAMQSFSQQFNVAIAMGCTRKRFLLAFLGTTAVFTAGEFLFLWILYHLEQGLYGIWMPAQSVVEAGGVLKPAIVLLVLLAAIVLRFVGGMIVLRFGRMGFYVVWFGYMILCIGGGNMATHVAEVPDGLLARIFQALADILMYHDWLGAYLIGYGLIGILFVIFSALQLHQEVRSA